MDAPASFNHSSMQSIIHSHMFLWFLWFVYSSSFFGVVNSKTKTDHSSMQPFIQSSFFFLEVFNVAYGANTTLLKLFESLRECLSKYDNQVTEIEPEFGSKRIGDIPHSQASILKTKIILAYDPIFSAPRGFELASEWYTKTYGELR